MPPRTLGIRHIALKVRDLAVMERFYVGVIGYQVEWRPDSDNVYLALSDDNLALHKETVEGRGALDHFGIMLARAEDVDAWASYFASAGVALAMAPKTHRDGTRSFYVDDPEGNTLQFIHHPTIARRAADGA